MYITLLNCQCDVFWPCIAIIIAVFLKKTAAIETAVVYLEHSLIKEKMDVHMFFFPFLCSGIPELALGILSILTCVCFCDVLQPAVY